MSLLVVCLAVVLASAVGGWLPLAGVVTHRRLHAYLSFSAGAMLGAAFFHMMPEAVESAGSPGVLRWCAAGLLALFFLERFFAYHDHESGHHEHEGGANQGASWALQWRAAAFGLAIHSLTGGVALASAWAERDDGPSGSAVAWGVFIATIVHKPADALTITSLMVRAGVRTFVAHAVNLGFALMIPLGALLFAWGLEGLGPHLAQAVTARALAFSAGTFLCVALSDLLPELHRHNHDRWTLSLSLLAGFGLMALTTFWHHEHG